MHGRRAGLAAVVVAIACVWQPSSEHAPELPEAVAPELGGQPLTVDDPPATIDELKTRIAKILANDNVPGVAIGLVDRDGPIWIGGVGVRDVSTAAPVDGDTVFRVGSISKCIVALGVMRLVDQGRLDLDRPLRDILPGLIDNPWEAEAPVTLAHVMEHTAGLDDVRFNEVFTDDDSISVSGALALNPRTRIVRWRPGTRHAYANGGFTIAARAIEVVTGESFDRYLRREILQPLGIVDAAFRRTDTLVARLATGYSEAGKPAAFFPFAHRPSAGLLISARELARLVQFWIRRGDGFPPIVSPAGLARIERNGTLPYARLDTDYGLASYGDVTHPAFARGHDGGMPGFHASFRYFPELGVGYTMQLNGAYSFRGYYAIRALLYAYLTKGRTLSRAPAIASSSIVSSPPGADYFRFGNPRHTLFAFIDQVLVGWRVFDRGNDQIRLHELQGQITDLVPAADGGYRIVGQCGSSVRFDTTSEGMPVMITSYAYGEAGSYTFARVRYIAVMVGVLVVQIVPVWAVIVLLAAALGIRRRRIPLGVVAWLTIASLSSKLFMPLLYTAFDRGVIGQVHVLTVALFAMSIVFPIAAVSALYSALRWWTRPDRPPVLDRLLETVFAVVISGMALWFVANGLFAFRTWAW